MTKILVNEIICTFNLKTLTLAPAVSLASHGIGEGRKITCYPALKDKIISTGKYTHCDDQVVVDGQYLLSDFLALLYKENLFV